jgi:hypothetical protein
LKTIKLDRRYNGYHLFTYAIDFTSLEHAKFVNMRNWLWETYGPSCELEIIGRVDDSNRLWAWDFSNYTIRLFLYGEKELNWFTLKWGVV